MWFNQDQLEGGPDRNSCRTANQQIDDKSAVATLKKMVINVRPLEKLSFFARSLHLVWTVDAEFYIYIRMLLFLKHLIISLQAAVLAHKLRLPNIYEDRTFTMARTRICHLFLS